MSRESGNARLAWAVALVSAFQLGLELLFIKLSRYEFGSLSLGVIGLSMLGVALAGPLTGWLGGPEKATRRAAALIAPTGLLAGLFLFSLEHRWTGVASTYQRMFAAGVFCLIPLALSSVPVFSAMRRVHGSVYVFYAASLAGATLGAPLAFALMYAFGDLGAFVALLSLGIPVAILFHVDRKLAVVGGFVALTSVVIAFTVAPMIDAAAHSESVFVRTNAFSRIDVLERENGRLWYQTAGINAGTSTADGTVDAPWPSLMNRLSAGAFDGEARRVLILGSGAGKNVIQALNLGAEEVVAVEINGMIPEHMAQALPLERDPYRDPRVELMVAEGRERAAELELEIAEGRAEGFDLVYVPIATLFGSSGHAFTQTYLMTREALSLYLRMLAPGGRVAIHSPDDYRQKVVVALADALREQGAEDPARQIAVVRARGRFLAVTAPNPGQRLRPRGGRIWNPSRDIAEASSSHRLTDDNPFLYNDVLSARERRSLFGWNADFLRGAFFLTTFFLLVGVAWAFGRRGASPRLRRAAYASAFAIMGIGYSAYQTVVIQRLSFLVGHPLLATALVLPSSLLGTAIGAHLSRRFDGANVARARLALILLFLAFVLGLAYVPPESLLLAGWVDGARFALALALSLPPFVVLGTYFAVAFARAEGEDESVLSLAWLLNGFGAVFGSVLAIYGPMMFGFRIMFVAAAVLYVSLTLWDVYSRRESVAHFWDRALIGLLLVSLLLTILFLELKVVSLGVETI